MSATADGARLVELLDAEFVESAGRMFPVDFRVHHVRPVYSRTTRAGAAWRWPAPSAPPWRSMTCKSWRSLPGMGEIQPHPGGSGRLRRAGAAAARRSAALRTRGSALRPAEQRRVVLGDIDRRAPSLTVLRRCASWWTAAGGGHRGSMPLLALTRLATLRSTPVPPAEQRAGTAQVRKAPGWAIRLVRARHCIAEAVAAFSIGRKCWRRNCPGWCSLRRLGLAAERVALDH